MGLSQVEKQNVYCWIVKNKIKLTDSIQSKSVEPTCAEFPSNLVRNSAKQKAMSVLVTLQICSSRALSVV